MLLEVSPVPTIITHTVIAGLGGKIFTKKCMPLRFWVTTVLCSIIPDLDVIGFRFGIRYGDFFGHRGFFHSPFFALVLSIGFALVLFRNNGLFSARWWKYVLFFFAVGASHGILDAFTDGGLGIALLSPFSNTRYFSPWTPLKVSPIRLQGFLTNRGLQVLICEIIYLWLPFLFIYIGSRIIMSNRVRV
jgi:inner membrane protein